MDEGAQVSVEGESIADNGTAMAKDGTIVFSAWAKEGYEITSVLVDGEKDARHNGDSETEYIIENIKTDETVVSVSTRALDAEESEEQPGEESVVKKTVTFQVAEGAAVTVEGEDVPDGGTAMAKNGTIVFLVSPKEGWEVSNVTVDHEFDARSTENKNEYIIEGIQTDETIVSVSTQPAEETEEDGSVVKKIVTFEIAEGAAVTADGENILDGGTSMAKDGTIIFSAYPKEGYEITSVIFDGDHETRKTSNESGNEYIIEGIQTDETIVTVSAQALETEAAETETETEAQETETEAKKKSDKVYLLSIRHVLNTGTIGSFEDVEEVSLTEDDFADGGYNVLQNAYEREGMEVLTPELVVTEKDFYDYGRFAQGMATIEYGVAEGYRAERLPKDGIMQMDVYVGKLKEVKIVKEEQIPVTVNFYYIDGTLAHESITELVVKSDGQYTFSYDISEILGDNNWTVTVKSDPGEAQYAEKKITATFADGSTKATINVTFDPGKAKYTVKKLFQTLDDEKNFAENEEKYPADEKEGVIGKLTNEQAEPIEGFVAQPIEQEEIAADGSTVIEIKYVRNRYTLDYDSQGGSYVKPQHGKYQEEITVYESERGIICNKEEHEHIQPQGDANWRNNGKQSGCYTCTQHGRNTSYSWDLTCGKKEHTHTSACQKAATYAPAPVREGYIFDGWYQDEQCTQEMDPKIALEDDTTVYAKWIPGTANYTIVYLKEIWDNSKNSSYYAYMSSSSASGTVGETVYGNWEGASKPAHYQQGEAGSAILKADGSTVVQMKYDLIRYTMIFDLNDQPGGRYNSAITGTIDMNGKQYHGKEYQITGVVLGQDISAQWPTVDNTSRSNGDVLDKWNGNWKTKRFEVTTDMLDNADSRNQITYKASWMSRGTQRTVEYWLQNEDGKGYTKSKTYSQTFYNTILSGLSAKSIFGFTEHDGTPAGYKGNDITTYRFYYDREKRGITYYYLNNELKKESGILFGVNINDPKYNYIPENPAGMGDYTFDGWYDDPDLTNKYVFGTMPNNDLVLYAKWIVPDKRVTYHLNDEKNTKKDETVKKGEKVQNVPATKREGFVFGGWYTDETYTTEWDQNLPVTNDMDVYAAWTERTVTSYTVRHVVIVNGEKKDVIEPRTVTGVGVGTKVQESAIVLKDAYAGYVPDKLNQVLELKAAGSQNVIEFIYKAPSELKYKVQYKYEKEVLKETGEISGEAAKFLLYADETIAKELYEQGYEFAGEAVQEVTLSGNEVTEVVFQMKPSQYKITYEGLEGTDTWGESGTTNPNPETYTREEDFSLQNPTRAGYIFRGWKKGASTKTETGIHTDIAENVYIEEGTRGDLTFIAVFDPILTSVKVTKEWSDGAELHTDASVVVQLLQDGIPFDKLVTLTAADGWTYTWDELFRYKAFSWDEHEYTVQEIAVPEGYMSSKVVDSKGDPRTKKEITVTITNTLKNPSLAVEKTASPAEGLKLGDIVTYTITVTNDGNVDLENVTVEDPKTKLNQNIGTLEQGDSTSVTTKHTITEEDILAGSFVNTATATGTSDGQNVSKEGSATVTTVKPSTKLSVTKAADKTTGAALGEEITYTITVTNNGNVTVKDIMVTDPLTGMGKNVGTLAPDKSTSVTTTHTITEADILARSFVNTATATGKDPKGGEVTGSDNETVTTVTQAPALTVEKTANKTSGVALGEEITYTIKVTNRGNVTVKDITVTDPLTGLNQSVGTLAPGKNASVTTTYTITEADILAGSFVNTATATGTDPKGGKVTGSDGETVTTVEPAPALTVEKTASKTSGAALGEKITYTITVTNRGNVTVKDITVTDPLTGLNQSVGTLAPGASAKAITTTYTVQEKDILEKSFVNTATATGTGPDDKKVSNSDSVIVETADPAPALSVVKEVTSSTPENGYEVGDTVTYTITVTNSGNVTVNDITVTDSLTRLNQSVGTLAPGESAEAITTTYTVQEKDILANKIENTATATGTASNGDEVEGRGKANVGTTNPAPDLTVIKTANKTTGAALGEEITYTITVKNNGNVTIKDITVTDPLTGLDQSVETLAPGASAEAITTTYTVQEKDILAGSFVNTATAKGTDPNGGEVTGSDDETVTTVAQDPALTVVKTASKESGAALNEEITYTITVTNSGNVTVSGIMVTDPKTGLKQNVGTLAPGEDASVTTTHTITEADILAGSFVNTATATGTDPKDGEVTGSDKETVTTVAQAPVLTVEKTADKTSGAELNDVITYTITVTNSGNVTVKDIMVKDPLTGLEKGVGTLAPGASAEAIKTTYTVQEKDILAGEIENTATATGTASNDEEVEGSGGANVKTTEPDPALTVEKTADKTSGAELNDVITYTITVTNSGNVTVEDITVKDPLTGLEESVGTLAPGASAEAIKTTYTVQEKDILAGEIENTATATGTASNDEEVEGSGGANVKTTEPDPALTVEKTADKTSGAELNDVITYTITVKNSGNVTVSDITVKDPLTGLEKSVGTLAPGEDASVTTTHAITEEDILAGKFVNTATAAGTDPNGGGVTGSDEETVTTVEKNPALEITKRVKDKNYGYDFNDTVEYYIHVENTGNLTLTDVKVTDPLTKDEWTIESLAPEENVPFETKAYTVTEEDIHAGIIINTASAVCENPEVSSSARVSVRTVEPRQHLTISKTVSENTPPAEGVYKLGETITYIITAKNDGNVTLNDVKVTDELTGDEWTIDVIAPGESRKFETSYDVTEKDILAGHVLNVATTTDDDVPVTPGEDDEPTQTPNPSLFVEKTAAQKEGGYELGEEITFHIKVTNNGNVTISDVTVSDVKAGLSEFKVGSLEPLGFWEKDVTYKVTEKDVLEGSVKNTAYASGLDPDGNRINKSGDAVVPTALQKPGLEVTKYVLEHNAGYELGDTVKYHVSVKNTGNLTLTDVKVTDNLTRNSWTIGSLAPGEEKDYWPEYKVTEENILNGSFVNTAEAAGKASNGESVEDDDAAKAYTVKPDPHITITKETSSTPANGEMYALGEKITYEITATNDGNVTVTDVAVTDELTGNTGENAWTIKSLAPGASETFTAEYVVTEKDILAGSVVNVATGTGTGPDPNTPPTIVPGEKEDPTGPKNGHLTITKETTSTPENGEAYALGEKITYRITVTNDGNLTLTNVAVKDALTGDNWTVESLAPGASETFTAEYVVTEKDILKGNVVNKATGRGTSPDPKEPNVPATPGEKEDPTGPKNGHLTITKETTSTPANGEAYALGERIVYNITATNDGNLTLTNIVVRDELTKDVRTITSLAPGASVSFTVVYVVTEADILAGKVLNVATATGTSPDPDEPDVPVDPGETEDTTESKNGHLTIAKATTSTPANGETYALGETITYEITATNDGNLTLTNVTVTDELTGNTGENAWTIASLAPKASKTFTASHVVTEADILAGSVVNVATATGTSPDPDEPEVPVDPGKEEDTTEPKDGHLTITKATTSKPANGEAYVLGETITYSITATNDGNLTLTNVIVTDELTGDTWTIESLEPKASKTFTAEHAVTEADILAGKVLNVATATGTSPDPEEPDVPVTPGEKEDPTEPKNGHLTITKTTTSTPENGETYALGETITYSITATNDGNLTLTGVTVTDELTGDAWTIAGLAPGESRTFEAEYVITEEDILAGSVVNVATAEGTSPDPDEPDVPVDPGEKEDPTEPKDGHLTVTKTTTSEPANGETYALGETVTYEITAENDGNLTLTDVVVTDELTGDAWTIESLVPGESETFTAEYVVTEADILAGSVVNVATAEGTSPDPDEPDVPVDPGEKEDPTEPENGHLTITKTTTSTPADGAAYALGETITYSITAENDGNLTLTDVTVTDELTGDAWTIESLAPGASETFTAEYVVTEADILAGRVVNEATATGTSPDADEPDVPADPGEKEDPTQTPNPSLFVEKTADREGGYALGDVVTYTVRVVNNGNVDVNDITVTDALTGDEWTIESLAPATAETFTAEHVVTEADILAGSITNVAAAAGTDPDGNEVEDDGSVTVTTEATRGHITVTKVTTSAPANGTAYALGETITYGVTATNDGNLTITDVTVTDGLTGDVWTAGTLAPGASQTFTASHVVTEADISAGSVVNTATAAGTSPDPDAPDVSVTPGSTEDPTEDRRPALTVDKAVTSTPASASGRYAVGETVSYQVTVTNTGNLTLENITLEDMITRPNGAQAVPDGLAGGAAAIGTLAPGESASITYSYVVTEADLGGILVNNAAAAGTPAIPDPTPETPDPIAEDSDSVAVETEDPLNSSITVSKTNVDGLTDALLSLPGAQFYVALFADEQLTQMVGGVQTLTFAEGQATASAAFTGLPRGTYYIAETDAAGNVLTSGEYLGGSFVPEYAAGQQVTITENGQNVSIAFRNLFATLPELEFSRMAELTITKEVKDTSGAPMNSDETFYAGLFADEACTIPAEGVSQQVIPLAMNGGSTASAVAEVTILNDGSDTVVYVAEVTADGTPVANAADFAYAVTVEGGKVTVNMDSPEASAKITNVTDEMRTDYYKAGELTVTKEVRNAKGRPANSDKTFYAGIFSDASYTNLADNVSEPVVALDMQGASKMSETVEVTLTDDGKDTVLYVTEVTKDGKPVAGSRSFAYEVTVEGGTVVMNGNAPEGSVKIINTKASGEKPEETETEEPETDKPDKDNKDKEDQSMSESETEGPQSIESVKTGDETPLTMWTILFLAAALAMFLTAVSEVRRRRSR